MTALAELAGAPALDSLAALLTSAGYRLIEVADDYVLAERAVPGMKDSRRQVVFRRSEWGWSGSMSHRRVTEAFEDANGFAVPKLGYRPLSNSPYLATLDDAACWLGGASSIPCSRAEVTAIIACQT